MFKPTDEIRLNWAANRPIHKRSVKGAHSYDILRNPTYRRKFQYISIKAPAGSRREKFIIDENLDEFDNSA